MPWDYQFQLTKPKFNSHLSFDSKEEHIWQLNIFFCGLINKGTVTTTINLIHRHLVRYNCLISFLSQFREENGEWQQECQPLEAHSDWVRDVAWAPSIGLPHSMIATCSQDGRVIIWTNEDSAGNSWTPKVSLFRTWYVLDIVRMVSVSHSLVWLM